MSDETNDWTGGFGTAPAAKGGNYFAPGVYDVTVNTIVKQTGRNPQKNKGQVLVILEATIDRVVTAYEADPGDAKGGWRASNRAGERAATLNNFTTGGETAQGNVKNYLLAILGSMALAKGGRPPAETDLDAAGWTKTLIKATEGQGTTFAGVRIRCYGSKTRTKAGAPFTPLRWEPLPPEAPAAAA